MESVADTRRRAPRPLALGLVAVAVAASACGSGSSKSSSPATTPASKSPTMTARSSASPTGTSTQNVTVTLTGKDTNLTLAPATVQALQAAAVQVAPVAPATAASGGVKFPVTGGTLTQVSMRGTIDHSGGLKFTHAGKTATASNFVLNTNQGILSATVQGHHVPLLAVDLTHLVRTTSGSEIVASGITSTLVASAAVLLDGKLATTVFTKGLPIGSLTTYLTGKPA